MYMHIDGTSYKSTLTGWRVLSIEEDGDDKYVRLISAGVPMTYAHIYGSTLAQGNTAVERITTKFFETDINETSTDTYFNLCGFKNGSDTVSTIEEVEALFRNDYTQIASTGYPAVSSITKRDLDMVYYGDSNNDGEPDDETIDGTYLENNDLLLLQASGGSSYYVPYYLADVVSYASSYYLYILYVRGAVVCTGGNYGIRPVVSLKASVETTGYDTAVEEWIISP